MYKAYVVELDNIRPHTNADRLNIARIFNTDVIIGKNLKVGDKVVYFPSDGQLDKDFAEYCNLLRKKDDLGNNIGGYMDPNKRNIKAIKLRGEYSDGIVIGIDKLAEFTKTSTDDYCSGYSFNEINGYPICNKYVPKKKSNNQNNVVKKRSKNLSDKYPLFHEHYDTAQLAYNTNNILDGDKLTISLKVHGSSQRTSYTKVFNKKSILDRIKSVFKPMESKYDLISGTRRVILDSFDGGFYGNNHFREQWHKFFDGKLEKGETVYYEVVGYTDKDSLIMPIASNKKIGDKEFIKKYGNETKFTYGCENGQSNIYVYRMSMTNEDGVEVDYSTDYTRIRCEQMGVNHVPILHEMIVDHHEVNHDKLIEDIMKYADGVDPIGKTHIREGIVVRIENRPKFTAYKHKSMAFKIIEGIIKEDAIEPDIEERDSLS